MSRNTPDTAPETLLCNEITAVVPREVSLSIALTALPGVGDARAQDLMRLGLRTPRARQIITTARALLAEEGTAPAAKPRRRSAPAATTPAAPPARKLTRGSRLAEASGQVAAKPATAALQVASRVTETQPPLAGAARPDKPPKSGKTRKAPRPDQPLKGDTTARKNAIVNKGSKGKHAQKSPKGSPRPSAWPQVGVNYSPHPASSRTGRRRFARSGLAVRRSAPAP